MSKWTRRHMALDIEGALRHPKRLVGCITVDGKTLQTVKEVTEFLRYQLAMGRELFPMADCEGFDYVTGCPGHEVERTEP